jgi:hypothetical protein
VCDPAKQFRLRTAAELLPEAAAANRPVFYDDSSGRPRTVAEVYQNFATRIERDSRQLAAAAPSPFGAFVGGDDVPALIRSLGFDGHQLGAGMAAMLNVFALSALKLLSEGPSASSSFLPPSRAL